MRDKSLVRVPDKIFFEEMRARRIKGVVKNNE